MNAYTTRGQARIQPSDLSAVLRANGLAGATLAGLEWQRECQAAAELDLAADAKHRHAACGPAARRAAPAGDLGGAGPRRRTALAGVPRNDVSLDAAPAASTLGTAS